MNAAAAWIAARLVRRLLPQEDLATRVTGGLILFVGVTLFCLQALGLVGLLSALTAAILVGGLLVVTLWLCPGPPQAAPAESRAPEAGPPAWLTRLSLLIAGAAVLAGALSVLTNGPWHAWDSLLYHSVSPAWWIQNGSIEPPPFNSQSYFPLNAEMHSLWFMLPFGEEAHANLVSLSWLGLLVGAFAVHRQGMGQRTWLAALAFTAALLAPPVFERLKYFTSADLGLTATLFAVLAFAWVPPGRTRALARALLSGLAAGIAVGMKPTAAPIVALAAVVWIYRSRKLEGGLRHVVVFVASSLLLGGLWYLRNTILTGNPFFPAAVGPFEGPLNAEAQLSTSLLLVLQESWQDAATWRHILESFLDWPLSIGLAAVAGYVAALVALFRTKEPERRLHIGVMLLAGLIFIALFPMAPFSATHNRPDRPPGLQPRYITFWFMTGMALLPCLLLAPTAARASAASVKPLRQLPALLGPCVLLAFLITLGLCTAARQQSATYHLGTALDGHLSGGWAAIEELPDGARIATRSQDPPSHSLIYPLFGRRLQHTPVAINLDGTKRLPLHENWREFPDEWWWEFDARKDRPPAEEYLRNLREAGVEYLLVTEWRGMRDGIKDDPEHPYVAFPRLLDRQRRVFADKYSSIWDIREERRQD